MNFVSKIKDYINKNKDVERIFIENYLQYEPERSSNGGAYAFYTEILKTDENIWTVKYDTSSDISFCNITGEFQECSRCMFYNPKKGCTINYTTYNSDKLIDGIVEEIKYYLPYTKLNGLKLIEEKDNYIEYEDDNLNIVIFRDISPSTKLDTIYITIDKIEE